MKYETPLTEPVSSGCSHCSPKPVVARMDMYLAVGFGSCSVTKDGVAVYDENNWNTDDGEYPSLGVYEMLARREPEADWRVHFYAPLYEAEYQRQGEDRWVLIRSGQGFA